MANPPDTSAPRHVGPLASGGRFKVRVPVTPNPHREAGAALPIVERLRRHVFDTTAFCPMPSYRNPDGPEAADTIERLLEALKLARGLLPNQSSTARCIDALLAKLETGDSAP